MGAAADVAFVGVGAVVGAMAGGPVGMAGGVAVGGLIDLVRHKMRASAATTVIPPPGVLMSSTLPPTADKAAASKAVTLMLLGKPAEVAPAQTWLKQFQTSVGLPATGQLDQTTRSMLVAATAGSTVNATRLPAVTILG